MEKYDFKYLDKKTVKLLCEFFKEGCITVQSGFNEQEANSYLASLLIEYDKHLSEEEE
jgi:hypothetical protein